MIENKGVLLMFYKASYGTLWDKLIAKLDGSPYSHVEIVLGIEDYQNITQYLGKVAFITTSGCRADTGMVSSSRYWEFESLDFVFIPESQPNIESHNQRKYSFLKLLRTKFDWWKLFPQHTDVCSTWVARVLELQNPDSYGVKDLYEHAIEKGSKIEQI